jgi:hypothetical protein
VQKYDAAKCSCEFLKDVGGDGDKDCGNNQYRRVFNEHLARQESREAVDRGIQKY